MKALWEAEETHARELQQATENQPPVDALLLSGVYEFLYPSETVVIEANYHVRTLTEGWHLVPLLGGDIRLDQAELHDANILWRDDRYCLLTHGKGDRNIQLRFALPLPAESSISERSSPCPPPSSGFCVSYASTWAGSIPEVNSWTTPGLN